jgi:hypothetical protein
MNFSDIPYKFGLWITQIGKIKILFMTHRITEYEFRIKYVQKCKKEQSSFNQIISKIHRQSINRLRHQKAFEKTCNDHFPWKNFTN